MEDLGYRFSFLYTTFCVLWFWLNHFCCCICWRCWKPPPRIIQPAQTTHFQIKLWKFLLDLICNCVVLCFFAILHHLNRNSTNTNRPYKLYVLNPASIPTSSKKKFSFEKNPNNTTTQTNIADSDRANNNSLIAHISNLPGFDASKARFVKQYSSKEQGLEKSTLDIVPTAAELLLPWRRDRSYQSLGMPSLPRYTHTHTPSVSTYIYIYMLIHR